MRRKLDRLNLNHVTALPSILGKPNPDTLRQRDVGTMSVANDSYYFLHDAYIEYCNKGILQFRIYVPENRAMFVIDEVLFAAQHNRYLVRVDGGMTTRLTLTGDVLKKLALEKRQDDLLLEQYFSANFLAPQWKPVFGESAH